MLRLISKMYNIFFTSLCISIHPMLRLIENLWRELSFTTQNFNTSNVKVNPLGFN